MSSNRLLDLGGDDDTNAAANTDSLNTVDPKETAAPADAATAAVVPDTTTPPDRSRRATLLADYGEADEGALGATVYAARTLSRRLSLLLARRRVEATLKIAHMTLDQALVPLGAALQKRQDDGALEVLAPLFEAVEAARRTARDKDTAREQLRASTANAQREIDHGRADSEATASKLEAAESALAAEENQLRAKLKRATALVQRCDIEMRAAEASVVTPDPEKINALLRQREEREADAAAINTRLSVVLAEVSEARRSMASARGVASALESERRAKDAQHQKVDRKHAKGTAQAHRQLDGALINLASVALDKNLVDVASEEAGRATKARARAASLREEIDDLIAADSAYDSEPYSMGVRVIGGMVVAIAVALFLILRA